MLTDGLPIYSPRCRYWHGKYGQIEAEDAKGPACSFRCRSVRHAIVRDRLLNQQRSYKAGPEGMQCASEKVISQHSVLTYIVEFQPFAFVYSAIILAISGLINVATKSSNSTRPTSPTCCRSFSLAVSFLTMIPMHGNSESASFDADNRRLTLLGTELNRFTAVTKDKPLQLSTIFVVKEDRFDPIYNAHLWRKTINGVLPKHCDKVNDGMCAINNPSVGPIVDGKLKHLRWLMCSKPVLPPVLVLLV